MTRLALEGERLMDLPTNYEVGLHEPFAFHLDYASRLHVITLHSQNLKEFAIFGVLSMSLSETCGNSAMW